jgi:hypothetical protein
MKKKLITLLCILVLISLGLFFLFINNVEDKKTHTKNWFEFVTPEDKPVSLSYKIKFPIEEFDYHYSDFEERQGFGEDSLKIKHKENIEEDYKLKSGMSIRINPIYDLRSFKNNILEDYSIGDKKFQKITYDNSEYFKYPSKMYRYFYKIPSDDEIILMLETEIAGENIQYFYDLSEKIIATISL